MNGVPLPVDAPSVAALLQRHGYRTALVGKAHFEPYLDPFGRFTENSLARLGRGDRRSSHGPTAARVRTAASSTWSSRPTERPRRCTTRMWLWQNNPSAIGMYYPVLDPAFNVNAAGGGATRRPAGARQPDPARAVPHRLGRRPHDRLADSLAADDDWFCWMSFPDPHHPWDPPQSELSRVDWRDVPLPAGYPASRAEREAILDAKPRHWRMWYDGTLVSNYEAPKKWVPATLTDDQVREVNARNAVEVELIDEAVGRVLRAIEARGWAGDTDVIFTTDHGELQGDFGLLFKGPYHVDALMRLPLIWRPAPSAAVAPARGDPAGRPGRPRADVQRDRRASSPQAGCRDGRCRSATPMPAAAGSIRVLTEWDSDLFGVDVHLRTITRDGWVCTAYRAGYVHDGTEGELYNLADDPLQRLNRWSDPACAAIRSDLLADLWDSQPPARAEALELQAPV